MENRRSFVKKMALAGAAMGLAGPLWAHEEKLQRITLLHTNDVHSHLEAFPSTHHRYPGMGGASVRSALIKNIRETHPNVILVDAGDMFQGTPYFNYFKGKPEIALMNQMGYDAATIGNHDFDLGSDNLAKRIKEASFPMINCNYGLQGHPLEQLVLPHTIITRDDVRIGITGVGINLSSLVDKRHYGNLQYQDPIQLANQTASWLKKEKNCHIIICLSHLGFEYETEQVSDKMLAKASQNIDIIIGGHTHTFLEKPEVILNQDGRKVYIGQVGWAGLKLGKIDLFLNEKKDILYTKGLSISV